MNYTEYYTRGNKEKVIKQFNHFKGLCIECGLIKEGLINDILQNVESIFKSRKDADFFIRNEYEYLYDKSDPHFRFKVICESQKDTIYHLHFFNCGYYCSIEFYQSLDLLNHSVNYKGLEISVIEDPKNHGTDDKKFINIMFTGYEKGKLELEINNTYYSNLINNVLSVFPYRMYK